MPPNLLGKAAFVRSDLENILKNDCESKDEIRTDFILQNIYAYILRNKYKFDAIRKKNEKEEHILEQLKGIINAFQLNYADTVRSLCSEIEVTEDVVGSVLLGVSNELFCEGITWSRIIALFVFVGEMTLLCLNRNLPESIVDVVYGCFCKLVKEKLKAWVDDHGGWEGLLSLSVTPQEKSMISVSPKTSNTSWAKGLLVNTLRVVGTIAHIANSTNSAFP